MGSLHTGNMEDIGQNFGGNMWDTDNDVYTSNAVYTSVTSLNN